VPAIKDLTGKRFGRLVATERTTSDKKRNARWLCKCDCGQNKVVLMPNLTNGQVRSCGCIKKGPPPVHGLYRRPTYISWQAMKSHCDNPNNEDYERYGGRGISYTPSWRRLKPSSPIWVSGLKARRSIARKTIWATAWITADGRHRRNKRITGDHRAVNPPSLDHASRSVGQP
jgi:hypothetical protein